MANSINDIVTVDIDLANPAIDSASFDNLLIVGPLPFNPAARNIPQVAVYSDLTEITEAGYVAVGDYSDPVGAAARIAFSQSPKPSRIYVASQLKASPLITGFDLKIITSDNAMTDALPIGSVSPETPGLLWVQIAYSHPAVANINITIEKDGAIVYGASLPADESENAYTQVCINPSSITTAESMNIPAGEEAGVYTVTLTAGISNRNTVITGTVTFDGNAYTEGEKIITSTPEYQTAVEALQEASNTTGWYVACAAGVPQPDYVNIAEWTEAQIKQFSYTYMQKTDPVGSVYFRSHGWCGLIKDDDTPDIVPSANAYLHVAAVAKCLSYPTGSETWAFKQLASVYPSELSSTLKKAITEGNSNYFAQYAGRNITMNGKTRGGEWIDIIRGRDWLQNDMQLRILNLLLMNPKIPYTNSGIALVETQMMASLKAAQERGIVATDEFDENNKLVPGFITSVPNSQSLTPTQKASRVLTDCKFAARLAGAIHAIQVKGSLTYGFN